MGRRADELDPVASIHLDLLAKALGKLGLLDSYYARSGIISEEGVAQGSLGLYVTLLNSARLSAQRLAEQMSREGETSDDLADYIEANYSRSNGDSGADE